jgi:hypothetical protein
VSYEQKARPTDIPVGDYLATVENPKRRADAQRLIALMEEISGEPPRMCGPSMIGFGKLRYTYPTGHSGEMFKIGFAPRKPHLVIYSWSKFDGVEEVIGRLGKIKNSAGCLYVKTLDDIDLTVLRELLEKSIEWAQGEKPGVTFS